jgi:hypothetical protein
VVAIGRAHLSAARARLTRRVRPEGERATR